MERFKTVAASYLFFIQSNNILLARRYNTGYEDGNYGVPAGHIDGGEPATSAAIREAKEEINVSIAKENLSIAHIIHRRQPDGERINFFFAVKEWQGKPSIMEPNKCDDISWFPLDGLPPNIIPYVKHAIEQYRSGTTYSEFGWDTQTQ